MVLAHYFDITSYFRIPIPTSLHFFFIFSGVIWISPEINLKVRIIRESCSHSICADNSLTQKGKGITGCMFSTYDADNDNFANYSCAVRKHGGWWYNVCSEANLNGVYLSSDGDGVYWKYWRGYYYSMKKTEMKIRPAVAP